jgi:hypothetical protein
MEIILYVNNVKKKMMQIDFLKEIILYQHVNIVKRIMV